MQGSTIVDKSVHYTLIQDPADVICELKGDPAALQKFMRNMDGSLPKPIECELGISGWYDTYQLSYLSKQHSWDTGELYMGIL